MYRVYWTVRGKKPEQRYYRTYKAAENTLFKVYFRLREQLACCGVGYESGVKA